MYLREKGNLRRRFDIAFTRSGMAKNWRRINCNMANHKFFVIISAECRAMAWATYNHIENQDINMNPKSQPTEN